MICPAATHPKHPQSLIGWLPVSGLPVSTLPWHQLATLFLSTAILWCECASPVSAAAPDDAKPAVAVSKAVLAKDAESAVTATDEKANTDKPSKAVGKIGGASLGDPARVLDRSLTGSAVSEADILAYINQQIRAGWTDAGISPSPLATDGEWCRRVFLDILGRIPSVEELNRFAADKSPQRKANQVNRLLNTDEYIDEYARNWTTIWTNVLIGRRGGTEDNTLIDRSGMQQYLRRGFQRNKSYDQMVHELISADGVSRPGEEGYNGAVNFLVDNLAENGANATAKTARYFLGLQVQCTQCHNHPFNEWKQDQFWSMNAFFRQTRAVRNNKGRDLFSATLTDENFSGEGSGGDPSNAAVFYELRNGQILVAFPKFVDGQTINPSGYVSEVNRRDELAKLVIGSEYLGKAIVNRMWNHFLGYAFTKPFDDIGPHNAASHPELLDNLGREFARQEHDLKKLIRWITLSEAYSLSSKFGSRNKIDDPGMGNKPLFSHFYLRQMQAEELFESLVVATEAQKANRGSYEEQEKQKNEWLQQFTLAFGTDEGDESTTFNGTIPQALMMMNGDLIKKATDAEPGSFLHKIATGNLKPGAKVDYLYMAALARRPSKDEVKLANALLAARGGDTTAALQDVWWALLNSNEFILNH